MKATKIKMKPGCANSTKTTEIDQIYIEGCSNPGCVYGNSGRNLERNIKI